jgi:hypothetical protein
MELPQNADIKQILNENGWEFEYLPNVRETSDWDLFKSLLTPQQLVRLKNIRCTTQNGKSFAHIILCSHFIYFKPLLPFCLCFLL